MPSDSGGNHFAAARPSGHEMWLNKAGGNPQVGLDKKAIDFDRRATGWRPAKIN